MNVRFGYGSPDSVRDVAAIVRLAQQADRDGLDHVSLADHPYVPDMLDGYAAIAFVLITFRPGSESEDSRAARKLVYIWIGQTVLLTMSAWHIQPT